MTRSLEQERAAYAWKAVQNASSDYANLAKAAPSLIMTNGLMQTLAFFKSKGKDHHKKLLDDLLGWFANEKANCPFMKGEKSIKEKDFSPAMNALSTASSEQYLHATQEALAILKWIRQFAAAATSGGQ